MIEIEHSFSIDGQPGCCIVRVFPSEISFSVGDVVNFPDGGFTIVDRKKYVVNRVVKSIYYENVVINVTLTEEAQ